jgi:uncharacterized protein YndB with AHSA1/START domain
MDAGKNGRPRAGGTLTTAERKSDRELLVKRKFRAPARLVFEAWTTPQLLMRWWAPKSFGITFVSCEADVRVGGAYRFVFSHPDAPEPMAFFGKYVEVAPPTRLAWTNEEGGEMGAVATVTFEEQGAVTLVVLRDLYPSKEALDAAIASGSTSGFEETFGQLDDLLAAAAS